MQIPWRRAGVTSGVAGRTAVLSVVAGLLMAAVLVPITGIVGVVTRDAANTFNDLNVPALAQVPTRSEILDSEGHLIAYFYPDHKYRIPVTYSYIAPVMRNAIVAIEDSRFYLHGALDPRGTLRALANDANNQSVQGGSDLAQQYVKNALELTAKNSAAANADAALTPQRKIRELRIAANVEHELTPHQLLAAYLNVAYFENSAYGIQVAAERYFDVTAKHLTLDQAAMLAGMVEDPFADDPLSEPKTSLARRNVVITRMAQLGYITKAAATGAEKKGLGLHSTTHPLETGCLSSSARHEAFFCDYALAVLRTDPAYKQVWTDLNTTGGLKIYTTMNERDEHAATEAVNYVQPAQSSTYNPGGNADTEVLLQPHTGRIRAIAEDRKYGNGAGETTVDYAVNTQYDGSTSGVQTGSSSKLFTLLTALEQGIPFGYNKSVVSPADVTPYFSCKGLEASFPLSNAEGPGKGIYTLYNGTTESINVFFAYLEQKVGLCNVVKTAAKLGVTRVDGSSLLKKDKVHGQLYDRAPEDGVPSFTLGEAPVSPMSMAGAYATVASNGVYCKPIAIESITTSAGKKLPVESARCHRVISAAVAIAATHILQGVLVSPGTASNRGINRPAAGKTGTANGGYYAAFAGYTPSLVGYVSVFNPDDPTGSGAMKGPGACYREVTGGESCVGQMYGDNAPAATWQMTFLHALLGPIVDFPAVPGNSPFYAEGTGVSSPKPPKTKHGGGGGGGHGGGHGGTPPTPGH